ncbi:MAG: hypothetical protein ACYS99_00375 [Planctomycetota bacterium]|jgi:hypothetical protein
MTRFSVCLALILGASLVGCGAGSDEEELRVAVTDCLKALADRDYGAVWGYLDADSREAIAKQLRDFQELDPSSPLFEPTWRMMDEQLDLSREQVLEMDAREYSIAMLEGMDRSMPELRNRQIEETRGRVIVRIDLQDDRAEVTTKTPSGLEETDTWVKEGGAWKCKARSVGEGVSYR